MKNLTEKAMLVSLSVSLWTGRKVDQRATVQVAADFAAEESSVRAHKALISHKALADIRNIGRAAWKWHREQTLAWDDNGARILPSENFFKYSEQMKKFEGEFNAAVYAFLDGYAYLVDDARVALGGLFDEGDYPLKDEIAGKFSFRVHIFPLPSSDDFRVALPEDELTQIRAEIQAQTDGIVQQAHRELWSRIHRVVSHMADKLDGDNPIFRDSLVGNVASLVDLLPSLNIADDPMLAQAQQDLEEKLLALPSQEINKNRETLKAAADMLREDPDYRKQVRQNAAEIAEALVGWM